MTQMLIIIANDDYVRIIVMIYHVQVESVANKPEKNIP